MQSRAYALGNGLDGPQPVLHARRNSVLAKRKLRFQQEGGHRVLQFRIQRRRSSLLSKLLLSLAAGESSSKLPLHSLGTRNR